MKKIFKLFVLICICFIPMMVDAKANPEFKNDYNNRMFFYEKNGEYFYFDTNKDLFDESNVVVYDKSGSFLRRDNFFEEDVNSFSGQFSNSKYFDPYYKMYSQIEDVVHDEENDILYYVFYDTNEFTSYYFDSNYIRKGFNDDLEFTKKLLGKKYDIYLEFIESDAEVHSIIENNGYYLVYYSNSEYDYCVSILDKDFEIIKTFESNTYDDIYCFYIYDDLIYVMTSSTTIEIYKLDGSLLESLTISHNLLDSNYIPYNLYIKNNELFIMYYLDGYGPYSSFSATSGIFWEKAGASYYDSPHFITLVYSFSYDVYKVEPSNGDFTYTREFDDEGREYVELNISPLKGYSVEDIIVTDIDGRRIDVTNNMFYMPASDVTVEVKFGGYIPIPDTFSNISPNIIVISILFIGCGIGIMCFSLRTKKAK